MIKRGFGPATSIPIVLLAVAVLAAACAKGTDATTASNSGVTPSVTNALASPPGTTVAVNAAPAAVAAQSSAGCQGPTSAELTPGTAAELRIEVAGKSHPYRVFVPAGLKAGTPVPMVLDLHGLTEPRAVQALVSGWEKLAEAEQFVVVTPQGGDVETFPVWNSTPAGDNPDTVWLGALIDKIGQGTCIDRTRMYSGGISNGGLESSILSCQLPDKIAAVGLVSGIVVPESCKSAPPKPVVVFWGMRDCVLPFYGGLGPCLMRGNGATVPSSRPATIEGVPPVEDSVSAWAGRNGCTPKPTTTKVSEHVEKHTYTGCRQGAAVEFYVIANGGHTWPGSKVAATQDDGPDAPKGITTMEIDATKIMWEFFKRYQNA